MTISAAGPRRRRPLFGWASATALAIGASLLSAVAATASLSASPSPSFPNSVAVGETFAGTVGIFNTSSTSEGGSSSLVTVSAIDLVPACANSAVDCVGGVDPGVFSAPTGVGTGSSVPGNATCDGMWAVVETTPGIFRLTPPGGEGTLRLAMGELCAVSLEMAALHTPSTDVSVGPGIQTSVVATATFAWETVGPFRTGGNNVTTVTPPRVAPPSDFAGFGFTDWAVYRPSTGVWYSFDSSVAWGAVGDVAVAGDYDGDGRTDQAVFRPSSGVWFVNGSFLGATATGWGVSTDVPVPADYDGDGKVDLAVFRPSSGVWYVRGSLGGATSIVWGVGSDIPVPADYDADGKADLAVFRPSSGVWYVKGSLGGATSTAWGVGTDVPVPGDYDGDAKSDLAVFRPSSGAWYVQRSGGGATSVVWGGPGDIPVPGDYGGDRKTDLAVFRPSSSVWYVEYTEGGTTADRWGVDGDVPVPLPAAIGRTSFQPPFAPRPNW